MIKRLMKSPLFMIGFLFLVIEIGASFYFDIAIKDQLPEPETVLYDEEGLPRYKAPFAPSEKFPFGTDEKGYRIEYKIIEGAKYTIGIALIITVLRMIVSLILGLTLRRLLSKLQIVIKGLTNAFHFAPLSLIAFFVLAPVALTFSWSFNSKTEIIFTIVALTILAVPTLALLITNEANQILQFEFIQNAKVLGGGYFHILRKHVRPYLVPRLFILFNQQMIQVLLLFAHLGVLGLYIGGPDFQSKVIEPTYFNQVIQEEQVVQTITSLSNEWGGLIALARKDVLIYPWELYYPALAFGLTIFAFTLMLEGMKQAIQPGVTKRRKKKGVELRTESIIETDFAKASNE